MCAAPVITPGANTRGVSICPGFPCPHAVTVSNTLYGLDRTTGAIEWSKNYGPAWPASAIGCGDLVPNIGATATPVYDPSTDSLYFTTKVDDGTSTHRHPKWLMH